METCVLIPKELSIVLLESGRPGHLLEMGATLWANRALRPGCIFLPDEGELRLDRLEIFRDLSDRDVRRRYGCFDEVLLVEKREVRHCNWVRFLQATRNTNEVNIVARRKSYKPEFHVIKPIPANGELKVYFDELSKSTSFDTLTSALPINLTASHHPASNVSATDATPTIRLRRRLPVMSRTSAMTAGSLSMSSIDDVMASSPTDLSMRKETSSFTSPSSGFDSPSMHCSGHVSTTGNREAMTSGSLSSDCVQADRSTSITVSPSPRRHCLTKPSLVRETAVMLDDAGYRVDDCSDDDNSSATSGRASPSWPASRDLYVDPDDEEHELKMAPVGGFTLPSLPLQVMRRKEKTWLPCDVCGKKFDRPSLLKRHMRTHTGEKPHACDVCFKAFSTSSSLNTHRRIHSGEKPHECPVCGKRFTASSNLYYHRMTHKKEKPHKCALCSKSFPTPGDLKSHMYVHSGSWPYKCDVCNRGFSKQANLKNHLLLHTGDKPHCCDLCGKKFALLCNLKTHIKMHEDESADDQLRCDSCGQGFSPSHQPLPTNDRASPSTNRCPDCVAAFARSHPSSTDSNSVSATPFSIDALVGSKDTGNDVIVRASPSRSVEAAAASSKISVAASRRTSSSSSLLSVVSAAAQSSSIRHAPFPFPPAIAAAQAQYYALAASGALSPLHYGPNSQFPVPLAWSQKSQQYGM